MTSDSSPLLEPPEVGVAVGGGCGVAAPVLAERAALVALGDFNREHCARGAVSLAELCLEAAELLRGCLGRVVPAKEAFSSLRIFERGCHVCDGGELGDYADCVFLELCRYAGWVALGVEEASGEAGDVRRVHLRPAESS